MENTKRDPTKGRRSTIRLLKSALTTLVFVLVRLVLVLVGLVLGDGEDGDG